MIPNNSEVDQTAEQATEQQDQPQVQPEPSLPATRVLTVEEQAAIDLVTAKFDAVAKKKKEELARKRNTRDKQRDALYATTAATAVAKRRQEGQKKE